MPVWAFLQWYGAPLIMATISAIYFFADGRRPAYGDRLISSAHGIVGVLLYFGALAIWWSSPNQSRPSWQIPTRFCYLVPLALIGVWLFTVSRVSFHRIFFNCRISRHWRGHCSLVAWQSAATGCNAP